jgi:hypothetical protein
VHPNHDRNCTCAEQLSQRSTHAPSNMKSQARMKAVWWSHSVTVKVFQYKRAVKWFVNFSNNSPTSNLKKNLSAVLEVFCAYRRTERHKSHLTSLRGVYGLNNIYCKSGRCASSFMAAWVGKNITDGSRSLWQTAYLLTYLLTYSLEQSPSWEANRFSASQKIPRILWNPKVHYRIHKFDRRNPVVFCNNIVIYSGARSGVVFKALRYKPAGSEFDCRWCHWNFPVT